MFQVGCDPFTHNSQLPYRASEHINNISGVNRQLELDLLITTFDAGAVNGKLQLLHTLAMQDSKYAFNCWILQLNCSIKHQC